MDLDHTPAGPPPPGVTPNLVDPTDQYGLTIACATAALVVTLPFVIIKLFTKARVLKQVQTEDYILVIAEITFIGWLIVDLCDSNHNAHIWDTAASRLPQINFYSNIIIALYSPTILFAKTAVLLQLQRIFVALPYNRIWYTTQSLLWSSTIFYIVIFFSCLFQCLPRNKIWLPDIPGTCLSMPGIMAASAIWNVLVNLGVLLIPVAALRGSRIGKRKKTIVFSVFSISLLAMAASIGRIVSTVVLAESDDFTYGLAGEANCALAEVAFMIIAASVPTTPAFLKYCSARLWDTGSSESSLQAAAAASPPPRPCPRRWDSWRRIDEEMAMPTTATTDWLDAVSLPPPLSPSALLPPPIVPPKDDGYEEPDGDVDRVEGLVSFAGELRHGVHPRAPPPSPARSHARTWFVDEGSSDEVKCEYPSDSTDKSAMTIMIDRPRRAHARQYRHRSV